MDTVRGMEKTGADWRRSGGFADAAGVRGPRSPPMGLRDRSRSPVAEAFENRILSNDFRYFRMPFKHLAPLFPSPDAMAGYIIPKAPESR